MTVVSLDMAYRSFLEVLAGSHPPRYAASLKPSSPRFTHSSAPWPADLMRLGSRDEPLADHLRCGAYRCRPALAGAAEAGPRPASRRHRHRARKLPLLLPDRHLADHQRRPLADPVAVEPLREDGES